MGLLGKMMSGAGRAFMGAEQRAARFAAQKEALAAQLEAQSPQAAQMIRMARDEMDLEDIIGRLQNPASFGQGPGAGGSTSMEMGADFGMRPPQGPYGR